jgi:hypothetical protein
MSKKMDEVVGLEDEPHLFPPDSADVHAAGPTVSLKNRISIKDNLPRGRSQKIKPFLDMPGHLIACLLRWRLSRNASVQGCLSAFPQPWLSLGDCGMLTLKPKDTYIVGQALQPLPGAG